MFAGYEFWTSAQEVHINRFRFLKTQVNVDDLQEENIIRLEGGAKTATPTDDEGLILDVRDKNAWYERNQKFAEFPYLCEYFKHHIST